MTAVEWLYERLERMIPRSALYNIDKMQYFEQAKELEKQQIIDAVEWGNRKGYDEHRLTCILDEDEQYYNETYKKP
jgi:hypothetical protein